MAIQQLLLGTGPKGYEIERSLRFNDDDSAYLDRTPSSAGNRKTMTLSVWIKRGNSGTHQIFDAHQDDSNRTRVFFTDTGSLQLFSRISNSDNSVYTTAKFRDPAAWYHIVFAFDMTQSTASNRFKIYVNGVQQTTNADYPAQNVDLFFNSTNSHKIGVGGDDQGNENYFDGYMAEMHWIDGTALTPSSFAKTDSATGQWIPIKYSGSYGTNGFYLNFSDNSGTSATTMGKDSSGSSNNYTPNNFNTYDSLIDTPSNNFCVMNSLKGYSSAGGSPTNSQGNLQVVTPVSGNGNTAATMSVQTGKWYAEVYIVGYSSLDRSCVFVSGLAHQTTSGSNAGEGSNATANIDTGYFHSGMNYKNATEDGSYGDSYTTGDIIGVALDLDNRTVNFYKNNTAQGSLSIASWGNWTFGVGDGSSGGGTTHALNFGQESSFLGNKTAQGNTDANGIGDFYYTPPTGYLALCSANLPTPVKLPTKYFDILTWTGNSTDNRSITGLSFQPDLTWIKRRSGGAQSHFWVDALRSNTDGGGGNGNVGPLATNDTYAESNTLTDGGFESFNSDGFTLGKGSSTSNADAPYQRNNANSETYVGWNWKAAGSTASNSDGSITSTVSANTTAGISIVGWTGTNGTGTVGHGLGVAPKAIIIRRRDSASTWVVYHERVGNGSPQTKRLALDSTGSESSADAGWFNNTAPTTTTFSVGNDGGSNGSTDDYIAYCFSEIEGFSSHGYYVGNGNTNGQMILTGFKPAFILTKRIDGTSNWYIWDPVREANVMNSPLQANDAGAEPENYDNSLDILSNGFKFRATNAGTNGSGDKYIYMAFAESPAKYSRAH